MQPIPPVEVWGDDSKPLAKDVDLKTAAFEINANPDKNPYVQDAEGNEFELVDGTWQVI
jgi:hypothetical protein